MTLLSAGPGGAPRVGLRLRAGESMCALARQGLQPVRRARSLRNDDLLVAPAPIACQPVQRRLIPCCYAPGDRAERWAMVDVDSLREPQRHRPHAEVAAPAPRPWPTRPIALRATVAGAGRTMDLDEFLGVTVSTALVVVVDGVLVHERYFHGVQPGDRLLGFSATKSALALLVGRAVDDGRLPD